MKRRKHEREPGAEKRHDRDEPEEVFSDEAAEPFHRSEWIEGEPPPPATSVGTGIDRPVAPDVANDHLFSHHKPKG